MLPHNLNCDPECPDSLAPDRPSAMGVDDSGSATFA
jgi:hypothetical protein